MRRLVLPGLVVAAAAALLALLAFGVAGQGRNTSIDAALARGTRPAAPEAQMALPILGSSRSQTDRRLPRQGRRSQRVRVVV